LVSPHRLDRPWHGLVESPVTERPPAYDAGCYLCPGNRRANGEQNPDYSSTHVFDNDYAALSAEAEVAVITSDLLVTQPETGVCRVLCFSPRHDLTLAELSTEEIARVVDTWVAETEVLSARADITAIQIFENKGELMGCSNPHPHGQIWAQRSLPQELAKELGEQTAHYQAQRRTLLSDYLEQERAAGERIVCENDGFTALVPFWAAWPFETLIIARRAVAHLPSLTADERRALADIIRRITVRYDNLFQTSFPYSSGIHQAPCDGDAHPEWHLHMHFFPPLLRSAAVRKFMVGYELLGEPQRDLTPEAAAARLRDQSEQYYLHA
jgi:UDPglucose--hexose-1-phosphate uridylyltransferase